MRSLFIVFTLFNFWLNFAAAAPNLSTKTQELSELTERIQKLEEKLKENVDARDVLVQELKVTETQIGQLNVKTLSTRDKLEHQQHVLQQLQTDLEKQEEKLLTEQTLLAKQLRAAYQLGHHEYAKLVLNQEHPAQISRFLSYYQYVSQARNDLIQSVKTTLTQLEQGKQAIAEHAAELERLLEHQQRDRVQLTKQLSYRQMLLSKQDASISNNKTKIENLSTNKLALEQLIQKLKLAAQNEQQKARHNKPLSFPTQGKVVSHFGQPIEGTEFLHNGILIHAPAGQKVHSIQDGKVVFAEWMKGFGLLMIIDHGHGLLSLYAHNESFYKSVGDSVKQGDMIASVGQSGGFKQSGLYFEIRQNGKPQNPLRWIQKVTA